jgi:hypothetical protein
MTAHVADPIRCGDYLLLTVTFHLRAAALLGEPKRRQRIAARLYEGTDTLRFCRLRGRSHRLAAGLRVGPPGCSAGGSGGAMLLAGTRAA